MQQYRVLCKTHDHPGSFFGWVYITASSWYEADQFFRAQYGSRIIGSAQPVHEWEVKQSWVGCG